MFKQVPEFTLHQMLSNLPTASQNYGVFIQLL